MIFHFICWNAFSGPWFDVLFSNVCHPFSSWNLLPSMGIHTYLRLYNSCVTSHFKGVTVCVCAVCCWAYSFDCFPRRNYFLLRDFPTEFQKCPFIPGLFFFLPMRISLLLSPIADVEIIEDTLPLLSLSLIRVWIKSSSLNSQDCLTYSDCSRWFKKYICFLQDTKCNNLYKILPSLHEAWGSADCSFSALYTQANNGSIIYLPLTRMEYSLNKIPWSFFFSSMNSLTLHFHCDANPFVSLCLYPRRLDNNSGVLYEVASCIFAERQ